MTFTPEELAANLDNQVWRKGFIYSITNRVNGRIYIGSTVDPKRRFYLHLRELKSGSHHSPRLQKSWNKYGEINFSFEVIEEVADINFLVAREQFWMWHFWSLLMNCAPVAGSPLGVKRTPEQRIVASESKRKFYATDAGKVAIEKARAKKSGRVQSDEERAMRSSRLKGNRNMGREWTDEQRAAHSIALTGRKMPPVSEETRRNISASKKGKPAHKNSIAASVKRHSEWIQKELPSWIEFIEEGKSFREIERLTGRSRDVVARECARFKCQSN